MSLIGKTRLVSCSVVALVMVPFTGRVASPNVVSAHTVSDNPTRAFSQVEPAFSAPQPVKKPLSILHKVNFGVASWYGAVLNGHRTASGEVFDMNKMTAAHRTLPFGTLVRVVDIHNGKSVVVRINDRGVLFPDRIIDLSRGAADALGIRKSGVTDVHLVVLGTQRTATEDLAKEVSPETPAR